MAVANKQEVVDPKPFVKWAGGKRQLMDILTADAPDCYGRYFEPFVGGGALLFTLLPRFATISDANTELINAYCVIRDDVEGLIRSLRTQRNTELHFYNVRARNPLTLTHVQRASRFIYMNKTCFNGLYRENSKGLFNAPFGRYDNPNIVDSENLRAVSRYLRTPRVSIFNRDYKEVLNEAIPGDFVYFDPPYFPLTQTASFTKYVGGDFGPQDQRELADVFNELAHHGVFVMLSNSNTPFIHNLYQGHRILLVEANRAINCKAEKRGKEQNEVLIRSW